MSKFRLPYIALAAIIAWFALALQFYISVYAYLLQGRRLTGAVVEWFSYFTIESNLLAALLFTFILISPNSSAGKFFSRASVITGTAVYMTIVGFVYNLVLRQIWNPVGLFKLADNLLHLVNPILFALFWVLFVDKQSLRWGMIFNWLVFPLVYLIYSLVRGEISGFYPYNFIDVKQIGYPQTFINSFFVLLALVGVSALFVGIGRLIKTR